MSECDFCLYVDDCIGPVIGPDGLCMAFAVPNELLVDYLKFVANNKSFFGGDDFVLLSSPFDG